MEGLARGRQVRSQRGEFRREIASADDPADAVAVILEDEDVPGFLSSMHVIDLVRCVPGIGRERGERLTVRAGVTNPLTEVAQMSFRQRVILGHELRNR
jgi:hypothetical protein